MTLEEQEQFVVGIEVAAVLKVHLVCTLAFNKGLVELLGKMLSTLVSIILSMEVMIFRTKMAIKSQTT